MFEALGRVMYRRRRWVVGAGAGLRGLRRRLGHRGVRLAAGRRVRGPGQRELPRRRARRPGAGPRRHRRRRPLLQRRPDRRRPGVRRGRHRDPGRAAGRRRRRAPRPTTARGAEALVSEDRSATYAVLDAGRRRRRPRTTRSRRSRATSPRPGLTTQVGGGAGDRPRHQRAGEQRHRPRRDDLACRSCSCCWW